MNNNVQKYIQHLADQAPTYSYPQPQKIDKPTIQKSLEDNEEWEKTGEKEVEEKDEMLYPNPYPKSFGREPEKEPVNPPKPEQPTNEQAIGAFGPEHLKEDDDLDDDEDDDDDDHDDFTKYIMKSLHWCFKSKDNPEEVVECFQELIPVCRFNEKCKKKMQDFIDKHNIKMDIETGSMFVKDASYMKPGILDSKMIKGNTLVEVYLNYLQEQDEVSSSVFSNFTQCGDWNPKCNQIKQKKQVDWNSCSNIKDNKQGWLCTSKALISYRKTCIALLQSDGIKYCNNHKDSKKCNEARIKAIKEHQYEIKKILADRKINIGS